MSSPAAEGDSQLLEARLSASTSNVAARLTLSARRWPQVVAIAEPCRNRLSLKRSYRTVTFAELDQDSDRIAGGLSRMGLVPGTRIALLVRPGIDFISLVFALFKAGAVVVLIDPGMGRKNLLRCLGEARPEGFVAVPLVQAVRTLTRPRFPWARFNVTVGRRWFWGGPTLDQLRLADSGGPTVVPRRLHDPAAIIFTTGSTGPPKGVLYCHGNFAHQVDQIRDQYGIQPGEVDLACFPLFGLFNAAMGVTTVVPDMDASRPAQVDPARIVQAVRDWRVTQSFGSPAVWERVARYCLEGGIRLDSLRRVLSAGAPVPPRVLDQLSRVIAPEGEIHTPYGATEALPVATISARQVLGETALRWRDGGGTCVGRPFPGIRWQVIPAVDGPIQSLDQVRPLAAGEIGELIVQGDVVTRQYVTRVEWNERAKIFQGDEVWHRMGDVGYLDAQGRFWFCGRLGHRVQTVEGPLDTIPCEAIYNQHPAVFRSALVGVGPAGRQTPVIVCQPWREHWPRSSSAREALLNELRATGAAHRLTAAVAHVLLYRAMPVDIRHNAKIFREKLAEWAAAQLAGVSHEAS